MKNMNVVTVGGYSYDIPISEFNIVLNRRSCKILCRGGGVKGKEKTCGKTLPLNRKNCVCRHNCMYINPKVARG